MHVMSHTPRRSIPSSCQLYSGGMKPCLHSGSALHLGPGRGPTWHPPCNCLTSGRWCWGETWERGLACKSWTNMGGSLSPQGLGGTSPLPTPPPQANTQLFHFGWGLGSSQIGEIPGLSLGDLSLSLSFRPLCTYPVFHDKTRLPPGPPPPPATGNLVSLLCEEIHTSVLLLQVLSPLPSHQSPLLLDSDRVYGGVCLGLGCTRA